jgi:uncharacterized membrane protein YphA (DoxX/SURF4 family)
MVHGYPKMTGLGSQEKASRAHLTVSIQRLGLPFPHFLAIVVGTIEFVGGILVTIGLLTKLAAFALAFVLLVATVRNFVQKQFLGSADFPFSVLVASLTLMLIGAGAISLDSLIFGG